MKKVLIVGGVAGGASAAARLRRLDESLHIVLFERDQYVSFANCGLPYHIGNVIQDRNCLLVQTPQSLNARFNLDIRINSTVTSLNTQNKTVHVKCSDGKEYDESYDYIVLAPGAKAFIPNIKGIDSKRIFSLRNMNDMDAIKEAISKFNVKSAVVVGGGFVGVESAENLNHIGIKTTLVEAAPNILAPFDSDMSAMLELEMSNKGINLLTNEKVVEFKEQNNGITLVLESGKSIDTQLVIFSIGVSADTEFLKGSNIALSERGHILVDESLKTNIDGIYAVGDAILVKNYVTQQYVNIPLAGPANRQARIAADNICGRNEKFLGSIATSILKVFDLAAASTGINEREAKKQNYNYGKVYLHLANHASYYPGSTMMHIKVIYDKDSQSILGAQAIGENGVDKFIDVLATTIKFHGTLKDLSELELAYAPPFLSAKSPANMAGFVGLNVEQGLVEQIYDDNLDEIDKDKSLVLDVREKPELTFVVEGSINLPLSSLRKTFTQLAKDKEIIIYCAAGLRGYLAARFLSQNGYKVKNIAGGMASISIKHKIKS